MAHSEHTLTRWIIKSWWLALIMLALVSLACNSGTASVPLATPTLTPATMAQPSRIAPTAPVTAATKAAATTAPAATRALTATLSVDDFYNGWIIWMDNLKTCKPYARTYLNPFLLVQQNDTIKGMEGSLCLMTQETVGKYTIECRLNAEGIKTLTRDELYQQAKNRTMSGSTSDPSSKVLSEQCKATIVGTVSAPPTATRPAAGSISNPASDNCVKKGGKLTIEKRGDGGEFGVCTFAENRQCEEWAMFRGECPVGGIKVTGYVTLAARYCAITGGTYAVTGNSGTDKEQGTCTFKNGKKCDAAAYYGGKCNPN